MYTSNSTETGRHINLPIRSTQKERHQSFRQRKGKTKRVTENWQLECEREDTGREAYLYTLSVSRETVKGSHERSQSDENAAEWLVLLRVHTVSGVLNVQGAYSGLGGV